MSYVKFYARNVRMEGQNISGHRLNVFDSDFYGATLKESSFNGVNFNNCNITFATFHNVSFIDSAFYRLITTGTAFEDCDFTQAFMEEFVFNCCTFRRCDFTRCNMENVTFGNCHFIDCDFYQTDLPPFFKPTRMTGCKNVPYVPMACPEEGEIIGYKIASTARLCPSGTIWRDNENHGPANVLVTLKIPADARRSSAGGRKCRCDKAEVIGLEHIVSHKNLSVAISKYDINFEYRIGEKISVPNFDENRWDECSTGIHFFINRKEALQYYNVMGVYYDKNREN